MKVVVLLALAACSFEGGRSSTVTGDAGLDGPPPRRDGPAVDRDAPVTGPDAAIAPSPDAPDGCTVIELVAMKEYIPPSSTTDGVYTVAVPTPISLPDQLDVTMGNAGNHCAELALKRASDNATIRCRYRGGANVAHPFTPVEIAAGKRYVFDGCTQGAACPVRNGTLEPLAVGDEVTIVEELRLHISNGDSYVGETHVRARIASCPN